MDVNNQEKVPGAIDDLDRKVTAMRFRVGPTNDDRVQAISEKTFELAMLIYDTMPNCEEKYQALNLIQQGKILSIAGLFIYPQSHDGIERHPVAQEKINNQRGDKT